MLFARIQLQPSTPLKNLNLVTKWMKHPLSLNQPVDGKVNIMGGKEEDEDCFAKSTAIDSCMSFR